MIKVLYVKWVLGHCRHLCACCEYKREHICGEQLKQELKNYSYKELTNIYKKGKYYGT